MRSTLRGIKGSVPGKERTDTAKGSLKKGPTRKKAPALISAKAGIPPPTNSTFGLNSKSQPKSEAKLWACLCPCPCLCF